MQVQTEEYWNSFKAINRARRSVKDFDGVNISEEIIEDILNEALLAPSSANSQPYEVHWIRTPEIKSEIAAACNGQRAATTASAIFVIVSSPRIAKKSLKDYAAFVEQSGLYT